MSRKGKTSVFCLLFIGIFALILLWTAIIFQQRAKLRERAVVYAASSSSNKAIDGKTTFENANRNVPRQHTQMQSAEESPSAVTTTHIPSELQLGPRITSLKDIRKYKYAALRDSGGDHLWLGRAIDNDKRKCEPFEKIFKFEFHQKYGAWAIKGHTRMYLTCELNNRITLDRQWARGFEMFSVEFVKETGQMRLISLRNRMYVSRFSDGRSFVAEEAKISAAVHWDVYAVTCADETGCWGEERVFRSQRRRKQQQKMFHSKKTCGYEAPAFIPLIGTPKPLPATVPPDTPPKYNPVMIARRTLQNWALIANVYPVILTDDPLTEKLVGEVNEQLATLNRTDETSICEVCARHRIITDRQFEQQPKFQQPTYRGVFERGFQMFPDAPAVMYSNSDILFTPSLGQTVQRVIKYIKEFKATNPNALRVHDRWMIVGQRVNVEVPANWTLITKNDETLRDDAWIDDVEAMSHQGKLFQSDAEDFFIVSRAMFDWASQPDFVVGGVAFDNWITAKAVRMSIQGEAILVDGSKTITAVHQNHGKNVKSSHMHPKSEYNTRLAMANGGWRDGHTADAPIATERRSDGCLTVFDKHRLLFQ